MASPRTLLLSAEIAFAASWRMSTLLAVVVAVPAVPTLVLLTMMFGGRATATGAVALLAWTGSIFAHEWGHALAHVWLRDDSQPIAALGGWSHASVVRVALPRHDHLVALAGPATACLAGGLTVAALAALGSPWPPALVLPPFLAHLISLHPRFEDGRQLFSAIGRY